MRMPKSHIRTTHPSVSRDVSGALWRHAGGRQKLRLLCDLKETKSLRTGLQPILRALRNPQQVERCAIVADSTVAHRLSSWAGALLPYQVRPYTDRADAIDWLGQDTQAEALHIRYQPLQRILVVEPQAALNVADIDFLAQTLQYLLERRSA